jgi:hypothetical protein
LDAAVGAWWIAELIEIIALSAAFFYSPMRNPGQELDGRGVPFFIGQFHELGTAASV